MMEQIQISIDELRPSNLYTKHTRSDVDFEAVCNMF
jgi:hypothetical protein